MMFVKGGSVESNDMRLTCLSVTMIMIKHIPILENMGVRLTRSPPNPVMIGYKIKQSE